MGCDQMMMKMSFVMKKEYLKKASVVINEDGVMVIRIDLHGLTQREAKKLIDALLLLNRGVFILDLIHGYVHGMELKKLIYSGLDNRRIIRKWGYSNNPGETFLQVAGI